MFRACYKCRACGQIFTSDRHDYTDDQIKIFEDSAEGRDFDIKKLINPPSIGMHNCFPSGSVKGFMDFVGFERIPEDSDDDSAVLETAHVDESVTV